MATDNKLRTRYYALRIGDFVTINASEEKFEVVLLDPMDNNRVFLKDSSGKVHPYTAENCRIAARIEDTCAWEKKDFGVYGVEDYEFATSCGSSYELKGNDSHRFCPSCGNKITKK